MAKGSRLTGVAYGLVPRKRAGMPDVITCISEGDDPRGRRRQGVNRPDDAPAGQCKGASPGAKVLARPARWSRPGNPCANHMIPLESPVPEIGTPGSESGGRKRAHGNRPAARLRKHRTSHRLPTGYAPPLDSTEPRPRPPRHPCVRRWRTGRPRSPAAPSRARTGTNRRPARPTARSPPRHAPRCGCRSERERPAGRVPDDSPGLRSPDWPSAHSSRASPAGSGPTDS